MGPGLEMSGPVLEMSALVPDSSLLRSEEPGLIPEGLGSASESGFYGDRLSCMCFARIRFFLDFRNITLKNFIF